MRVHHIGYLVKKIEKAADSFAELGFVRVGEMTHDESRRVDILFVEKDGYLVELVSPYSPDSVVANLIKTYKNAPYHLCYEAEDFSADLAWLEANGYIRIDEPTPAPALAGRRVAFFMNPVLGMLELAEQASDGGCALQKQ